MVTDAEQDESTERKRANADVKIRLDERDINGVGWIRHVRPEREESPDPPSEGE